MYTLDTKNLGEIIENNEIPNNELSDFLKEWLNSEDFIIGHTSGSTGKPKAIKLKKEDMRASARITNRFFHINDDSNLLLCLSVSYIAGKMMVIRALEAGAKLWCIDPCSHPLKKIEWKKNICIDLAAMVPFQVEESLKSKDEISCFAHIRQLLVGGAPVSAELESTLRHLTTLSYATYGMTETVSHVALRRIGYEQDYFALSGITFQSDQRGCLVIHAPHLETHEFITNDLVSLMDNKHFKWLGRYDNVINSGGLKFFPEMIERKIEHIFQVRYFITSKPDNRLGEKIILVLEQENEISDNQIKEMQDILTKYEMPKEIVYLNHFKETRTGKVIRRL